MQQKRLDAPEKQHGWHLDGSGDEKESTSQELSDQKLDDSPKYHCDPRLKRILLLVKWIEQGNYVQVDATSLFQVHLLRIAGKIRCLRL